MLGGVSDEQAAEAAAHQTEADEEDEAAVEDGDAPDDDDDLKGVEDDNEEAVKATHDAEDEGLQAADADTADSTRKSGKKRNMDGHQAGTFLLCFSEVVEVGCFCLLAFLRSCISSIN